MEQRLSGDEPLFVDLDGALLEGSRFWEAFVQELKTRPLFAIGTLLRGPGGRTAFMEAVTSEGSFEPARCHYNPEVVAFARAQAEHRPVLLITKSSASVAEAVAGYHGFFSGTVATEPGPEAMLCAIQRSSRGDRFDYIGAYPEGRPIWQAVGRAYAVLPAGRRARADADDPPIGQTFTRCAATPQDHLSAMRLHQWVKNLLIFVPALLSHRILEPGVLVSSIGAFLAFSLLASATYILNDILDIASDRTSPHKKNRPLAACRMSIPRAAGFAASLLASGVLVAGLLTPPLTLPFLAGYIAITLAYSLSFKRRAILDVVTLAVLYGYRIAVGGAATGIPVSDWLIAFSIFFFLGLALVKRFSEVEELAAQPGRAVAGRAYSGADTHVIGSLGIVSSFTSVLVMALYITSPAVAAQYQNPRILWFVCLILIYWISHIWLHAWRSEIRGDPIVYALRDKTSYACGAFAGTSVLLALV